MIPCLDVDAGRVVKGVNFQRPPRRRRPGRAGPDVRRRGRRRADLPRHLGLARGPGHHAGDRVAHGRAGLHPAHRRRGSGGGRRRRPAAAGRGRQGRGQHRRHPPPRAGRRDRRPLRQPGARPLASTPGARRARTPASRSPPTAAARRPGSTRIEWAARAAELGAGEILLNAMDADGTQSGFDLDLIRLVRVGGVDPGHRLGRRRGRLEHFPPAVDAGADAVLAATVFHFGTVSDRRGEVRARGRRSPGPLSRFARIPSRSRRARSPGVLRHDGPHCAP